MSGSIIRIKSRYDDKNLEIKINVADIEDPTSEESKINPKKHDLGIILVHPYPPLGNCFVANVIISSSNKRFELPGVSRIVLVGYSFGSMVVSGVDYSDYGSLDIKSVFISYPYSILWVLSSLNGKFYLEKIKRNLKHNLSKADQNHIQNSLIFISGTQDNFTSFENFKKLAEETKEYVKTLSQSDSSLDQKIVKDEYLTNCNHFYIGREGELSSRLIELIFNDE
ncbi:hypothetical protein AYI68_g908 [Smittium mucronatum]|uniref:Uncharacterized protein n=1 Tax=Smittium mucronatum TaxID=133383 RepID=A0A1R0H6V3_9FUNG|nr:hypothetical protein AYI68_g908 [Smittium mucronatum]